MTDPTIIGLKDALAWAAECQLAALEYVQGLSKHPKHDLKRHQQIADRLCAHCREFRTPTARYPRLEAKIGRIEESKLAEVNDNPSSITCADLDKVKAVCDTTKVVDVVKFLRNEFGYTLSAGRDIWNRYFKPMSETELIAEARRIYQAVGGGTIEAIKFIRFRTGMGLSESKAFFEKKAQPDA